MSSTWTVHESFPPRADALVDDAEEVAVPTAAVPAPGAAQVPPSTSRHEILRRAEALGIPWERLLTEEIEAELRLRRYLPDLGADPSIVAAGDVLSFSLLRSWRVRDRVESLACEARTAAVRGALRELRLLFRRLVGKNDRNRPVLARHLSFAYQRVLLLLRVRRAARRSRGSLPERLAAVCSGTRCGFDDAAWAIDREDAGESPGRLEDVVRKVRDEGFQIPRAATEARALAELRRMVRRRPARPRKSPPPISAPKRVPLPLDAF